MGYNVTFSLLSELLLISAKGSVKVASTGNVVGYLSGGPGHRIPDISLIDGETLGVGDRVLLKDQSTGAQNGIWVYVEDLVLIPEGTVPVAGAGLVRASDAFKTGDIVPGALIPIQKGTEANNVFILSHTGSDVPIIGVDGITFVGGALGGGIDSSLGVSNETNGNDMRFTNGDELQFEESGGTDYVALTAPASVTSTTVYILPEDGNPGEVLSTDGAGNLAWVPTPTVMLTFNAGETITSGDTVSVEYDGGNAETRIYVSDANHGSTNRRRPIGIAETGGVAGVSIDVFTQPGRIVEMTFGSAPATSNNGDFVYLSETPGEVTLTPPTASGSDVFKMGILTGADGALTSVDVIYFPEFVATNT